MSPGPPINIAVMQPYFLPHLPYFQLILAVDVFVHFDDVQFIRRGWINRNRILLHGVPHTFTVPVSKGAQTDLILEKRLASDSLSELHNIRITLTHAYRNAPFRTQALDLFDEITEPVLSHESDSLLELLTRSVEIIADKLEIRTSFIRASTLGLPRQLKGKDRILTIAHKLGATSYLNPIGGQTLYDSNSFRRANVRLGFIQTDPGIRYPQGHVREFVPNLSIIDVIANIGVEGTRPLLARWRQISDSLSHSPNS
jgi:hypothetical protein